MRVGGGGGVYSGITLGAGGEGYLFSYWNWKPKGGVNPKPLRASLLQFRESLSEDEATVMII